MHRTCVCDRPYDLEITLSAAVGSCSAHSTGPDEVLREADRRMYEGKRGR